MNLKRISLGYLMVCAVVFFSCEGNSNTIDSEVEAEKDSLTLSQHEIQSFELNLQKECVIAGQKGTIITFPSYCFGENNSTVKIELIECYDIESMIYHRLSTITDGNKLLETEGMLNIRALNEKNQELRIEKGAISIQTPSKEISYDTKLFIGNGDEFIRWTPIENNIFTPNWVESASSILEGNHENGEVQNFFGEHQIEIMSPTFVVTDSIKYYNYDKIDTYTDIKIGENIKNENLMSYVFQISQLGWINLDKYVEGEVVDVVFDLTEMNNPNVDYSLVLENYNSVVVGEQISERELIFKNVPKNEVFTIVALSVEGDRIRFEMISGNSNNEKIKFPALKPISREKLTNRLINKFGKNIWNRPIA